MEAESWKKILYNVDDNNRSNRDLNHHPENPDLLWVSMLGKKKICLGFCRKWRRFWSGTARRDGGEKLWSLSMKGMEEMNLQQK